MAGRSRVATWGRRLVRLEAWQWITAVTIGTIVVIAVDDFRADVVPLGDNAIIEVRSRDVFSRHPPIVNMLSTVASDGSVRHPGPLLFDLLAIPVRLASHGRGVLIGVTIIHGAVIWTIGRTARRFLGEHGAAAVAAAAALLVWSLGREILLEPWQPHVALPAFFLLLVAAWGFATGCDRCAPAGVFAFSFVLQTHASYLVVAPAVVTMAVVLRLTPPKPTALTRRPIAAAAALFVVLWAQPVFQQFFAAGRGNLGAVFDVATDRHGDVLGLDDAIRSNATVLARPPFWLRPGISSQLPVAEGPLAEQLGLSAVGLDGWRVGVARLAVIAIVLVAVSLLARRRRDRVVSTGAAIAGAAVLGGIVFTSRLPVDPIFGFMVHKVRWLWPVGAFLMTFLVVVAIRWSRWSAARGLSIALIAASAAALVSTAGSDRGDASIAAEFWPLVATAAQVRESLGPVEGVGTVYVPVEQESVVAAFFDTSIIAELVERRVPVRLTFPLAVAQYGSQYALDDRADRVLRVYVGPDAPVDIEADVVYQDVLVLDEAERAMLLLDGEGEDLVVRVTLEPFVPAVSG